MRRLLKWSMRLVAAAAILTVLLWLAQAYLLPRFVRARLLSELHALGLGKADIVVERIGLTEAELSGLLLEGDRNFSVDEAHVTYTAGGLFRGRIATLVLTGARVRVAYVDGKLDLGPLARLQRPQPSPASELPFDRFELRSSLLTLLVSGRTLAIPIEGAIEREGRALKVDLNASIRDQFAHLAATVKPGAGGAEIYGLNLDLDPKGGFPGDIPVVPLPDTRFTVTSSQEHAIVLKADRLEAPELQLEVGAMRLVAADQSWRTEPMRWSIASDGSGPLLSWGEPAAQVRLRVRSQSQVLLSGERGWVGVDRIDAKIHGVLAQGQAPRVDGSIDILRLVGEDRTAAVAVADATGSIAITVNGSSGAEPGRLTVEGIRVNGRDLPSMTGGALLSEDGAHLAVDWKLGEEAVAHARVDLTRDGLKLGGELPETELAGLSGLLSKFVELGDARLSGRVGVQATGQFTGGRLRPSVKIALHDVGYSSETLQTALNGVNGNMEIINFKPPATPGGQRLKIRELRQGKIALTDGTLAFHLEWRGPIFIERTDWKMGTGGRVTAHAIRYDPARPRIETELFVDELNLEDWISVLTNEKVAATGKLYGRVPIRIAGENGRYQVAFGEGFLYSTAAAGTLRVPDAARVSQMLSQADPRFARDPNLAAVKERLAGALTDFEYSMFRFDLIPRPDRTVTLRVQTRGKGRGPDGQEVSGLTVNINGFDELANLALFGRWLVGEGIEKRLEEFFKPAEDRGKDRP